MKSGIYKIVNKISGDLYVGSSCQLDTRKTTHFRNLRKGNNHCKILQRAYSKYGEESFEFIIIEYCEKDNLIIREQYYLEQLKPKYNACKIIPNQTLGFNHSESSKELMSDLQVEMKGVKLYQYDNDKIFLKEWKSCSEFAKYYKINRAAVFKALRKGNKCAGFIISKNLLS